jgi:hypothetical protein
MWQRIREFFSRLFDSSDDDEGKPPRVEVVPPNSAPISAFYAKVASDDGLFAAYAKDPTTTIQNYPGLSHDDKQFLITAVEQGQVGYDEVRGRMKKEASTDSALVWICIWIHQVPTPPHTGSGTGPSPGDG